MRHRLLLLLGQFTIRMRQEIRRYLEKGVREPGHKLLRSRTPSSLGLPEINIHFMSYLIARLEYQGEIPRIIAYVTRFYVERCRHAQEFLGGLQAPSSEVSDKLSH